MTPSVYLEVLALALASNPVAGLQPISEWFSLERRTCEDQIRQLTYLHRETPWGQAGKMLGEAENPNTEVREPEPWFRTTSPE